MAEDIGLIEQRAHPMDIVSTGVILTYENGPIEIVFGDKNSQIKLIIAFEDTEDGERSINGKTPDQFTLELTLFNFNDIISGYPIQPISIGVFKGHKIFLNFTVQTLKNNKTHTNINKIFNYTIYRDPTEVQDQK